MKKILVIAAGLLFSLFSFAQKINDPNAEIREAKDYHSIKLSSSFDVYITQSNEESVAVSASEKKYMDEIEVKVEGGVLSIGMNKNGWMKKWNGDKMKLKAYISFKTLKKLDVSGACDVYFQGVVKANDLKIHLSGASDIKGDIDVNKLDVDLSGASDITVKGKASTLKIQASGASDFKGYGLNTEFCDVDVSGASGVKITVNKELSAKATGASDVRYQGTGLIREIKTSGASSVSRGG
jgi:hypothetical protein